MTLAFTSSFWLLEMTSKRSFPSSNKIRSPGLVSKGKRSYVIYTRSLVPSKRSPVANIISSPGLTTTSSFMTPTRSLGPCKSAKTEAL